MDLLSSKNYTLTWHQYFNSKKAKKSFQVFIWLNIWAFKHTIPALAYYIVKVLKNV